MYHIEIIGMRKKRDKKIILALIICCVIGILASVGVIVFSKKTVEVAVTNVSDEHSEIHEGIESLDIIENSSISEKESNIDKETTEEKDNTTNNFNAQEFIKSIKNIYNGEEGKRVFLTFDDGPTKEVTPHILDILKEYNVKATFFVLGNRVEQNPDLVKRAYNEGHYIANHSYSHKYSKIYKDAETVLSEYNKTENAIRKALNKEDYSSHLFRFPGGSHGGKYEKIKKDARKKMNESGVAFLDWSALTFDAEGAKTTEDILKNLKNTMKGWNNVVVLMHDAADKKITYESLDDVIKYLQKEGYKFENIYDLI